MKYTFANILDKEIYERTRVMFVVGRYNIFNNLVADSLKEIANEGILPNSYDEQLEAEFNISENDVMSSALSIDEFFDVAYTVNITGKWFCRAPLSFFNTKKQKDRLIDYMKSPSRNAILVLLSNDWFEYKDWLRNKLLLYGQHTHIMQLGFPKKDILREIVESSFLDKGYEVEGKALEHFLLRANNEYDSYEDYINDICEYHKERSDTVAIKYEDMKIYMSDIENFDIQDFMYEIIKPLSSGKTTNKKIIRMLANLMEKYESPELLVRELLKQINEMIDYRLMINKGIIPININYLFSDVVKALGKDNKYTKVNEWLFRRKANLAAMTSLKDWEYMRLTLMASMDAGFADSPERKQASVRALYDLVNRSVICEDRLNNIINIDNVLNKGTTEIDRIIYEDKNLGL